MNALMITVHVLAAIIWVGGMAFALMVLRPSAGPLDPPIRLALWQRVFGRFFIWVWAAVILLPLTGIWLIIFQYGGWQDLPLHLHLMQVIGWIMVLIFLHLWFVPYRRFTAALAAGEPPAAAEALDQIRKLVLTNLVLGLITAAIGASGRYWTP